MTATAQLVVTTHTREGRHVSEVMPRPQAETLLAMLERLVTEPNTVGPPATVRFRTFGPIGGTGGEVLLTGEAIIAVELLATSHLFRSYRPRDTRGSFTHQEGTIPPGPLTTAQLAATTDD